VDFTLFVAGPDRTSHRYVDVWAFSEINIYDREGVYFSGRLQSIIVTTYVEVTTPHAQTLQEV